MYPRFFEYLRSKACTTIRHRAGSQFQKTDRPHPTRSDAMQAEFGISVGVRVCINIGICSGMPGMPRRVDPKPVTDPRSKASFPGCVHFDQR